MSESPYPLFRSCVRRLRYETFASIYARYGTDDFHILDKRLYRVHVNARWRNQMRPVGINGPDRGAMRLQPSAGDQKLSNPTIAELQLKNNHLRQLVMLLGRMFLISAAEQREARAERSTAVDGPRILSMMGIQTITRLRLVASHCAQLGGVGGDQGIAKELETLAAEIADEVDKLETTLGSGK